MRLIIICVALVYVRAFLSELPMATSLRPECNEISAASTNWITSKLCRPVSFDACHQAIDDLNIYSKQETLYLCKRHWSHDNADMETGIRDAVTTRRTGCGFYRVSRERMIQCICASSLHIKNEPNTGYSYSYIEHLIAYLAKIEKGKHHSVNQVPAFGEGILPKWAKRKHVNNLLMRVMKYISEASKSNDMEQHRTIAKHYNLPFNDKVYTKDHKLPEKLLVTDKSNTLRGAFRLLAGDQRRVILPTMKYSALIALWPGTLWHIDSEETYRKLFENRNRYDNNAWLYYA